MASTVALKAFDQIQIGRESTKGTRVAATRRLVGGGMLREVQERYYSQYPRGVLATVGGDGVLTMKGTEFEIESELCPQEILWPLLLGIKGNITPTGAGADKTWTFDPTLTSEPALDAATIEFALNDGSTNHVQVEAGYCMAQSLKVDYRFNEIAKLSWKGFGRARQSDTPTAALAAYTNRQILVSPMTTWYVDTAGSGIGGTQLQAIVRSATWEAGLFPRPDWTMDGRSDLDFVSHRIVPLTGKLSMVVELNSDGAARYTAWRAGTRQFIRAKTTGIALGSSNYTVQLDGSFRILSATPADDDGQRLVNLEMEAVHDETWGKIMQFLVVCDLAAVANL